MACYLTICKSQWLVFVAFIRQKQKSQRRYYYRRVWYVRASRDCQQKFNTMHTTCVQTMPESRHNPCVKKSNNHFYSGTAEHKPCFEFTEINSSFSVLFSVNRKRSALFYLPSGPPRRIFELQTFLSEILLLYSHTSHPFRTQILFVLH